MLFSNYEVLLNRKQSHRELKQFILNTVNNRETLLHRFEISVHPESSQHVTPTEHTVLIKMIKIDSHFKMLCFLKDLKQRLKWLVFLVAITKYYIFFFVLKIAFTEMQIIVQIKYTRSKTFPYTYSAKKKKN